MKNILLLSLISLFFLGCTSDEVKITKPFFIKGVDLSYLPEIQSYNIKFYNDNNQVEDMLTTFKNKGCNTVRIRLWKDPVTGHSGFLEVQNFAAAVKAKGLKVWLSVHYSDTWADPGHQVTPKKWQNLDVNVLSDSVFKYTRKVVKVINPDFIQIGNEVNNGFLFPQGNISNESNFRQLLSAGIDAVRKNSTKAKIIIHYAGVSGSLDFYKKLTKLDYDIIGLSYYPIWHGKDFNLLQNTLNSLASDNAKEVMVAETAYPFTLGYNDLTTNIIGYDSQISSDYPATPEGQKGFLSKINTISKSTYNNVGFCYWGGEFVAFYGTTSSNGSPWENQALFDFTNKALPAMDVFSE